MNSVVFGHGRLTVEDIVSIAKTKQPVEISNSEVFSQRIDSAVNFLDTLLKEDGVIYGVTTGYGDSVTTEVPLNLVEELPLHLTRFHGCGLGDYFNDVEGKAILATRLASLSQGFFRS